MSIEVFVSGSVGAWPNEKQGLTCYSAWLNILTTTKESYGWLGVSCQ